MREPHRLFVERREADGIGGSYFPPPVRRVDIPKDRESRP
jgi:retron-type reverse transcriptase